jgi:response regulator RpfG family c-di-GMP phosphodiesterase
MTHKLLIVDDEAANLRLLERLFSKDFHCLTASSGVEAIRLLEQHDIAILITDQRMPGMTGIELLKRTARLRPHMVRILLTGYTDMEALVEALNSGLVYMYVTKPWNNEELKLRVNRAGEHYQINKNRQALADANQRLLVRMEHIKLAIVTALGDMLKIRDKHAAAHALRVRDYALMIATKLNVSEEQKQNLSMAAMLQDLGGTEIFPRGSLSARVSPIDQTIEQAESECAARLFDSIPEFADVWEIVSSHRENFDGSGSPRGLKGEQIPLLCRILRLADEYDQMVLPKSSPPMIHDEAMRFLIQRSGKQFDPRVIEVLSQLTPEERGQDQDPVTTHGEDNRPTQDSFEPSYVDAVFS